MERNKIKKMKMVFEEGKYWKNALKGWRDKNRGGDVKMMQQVMSQMATPKKKK